MDFISPRFIIFIVFGLIIFYLFPRKYRSKVVIPSLNIIFILTFVKHVVQLLPLVFFLLIGFVCIKAVEKYPTRKTIILSIIITLAVFLYLKRYSFISLLPFIKQPYLIIGLSYILFRVLHILIYIYDGAIKEKISMVTFFNYSCFFLSFISGPIQRFQEYIEQEQAQEEHLSQQEVFKSFSRIINGYLKITILSAAFLYVHNEFYCRIGETKHGFNLFSMFLIYFNACVFYCLYLYYNFSGYMDVVIGIGCFFGFRLPENFNKPFMSQSFLEFWTRWHITLSDWFKVYVFNPLVKALVSYWPNSKVMAYYGVVGYFITFLLMGIWHGSLLLFIIYGIFLALGMSVNKLYEIEMRRRLGKSNYTNMCNNKIYRLFSAGLTYSYFMIGLSCVWMPLDKLTWLYGKINLLGFFGYFIFGGTLVAIAILFIGKVLSFCKKGYRVFYFLNQSFYFQQGLLSFKALLLFFFLIFYSHSVPEFIYKAF